MNQRERLAFLAKHYNRLKNLRLAPVYLFFIVSSWVNFEQVSVNDALITLGAGIAWFWLLNRYYKEHYGQIEDKHELRNTSSGAWLASWLFIALGIVAIYFVVVRGSLLPQDFMLWFLVAAILAEGLAYSDPGLRRWYYIVIGMISAAALLLGFAGNMPWHHFFHTYEFKSLGVALLTLSIFDHLLLVRTFRPVSPEINA